MDLEEIYFLGSLWTGSGVRRSETITERIRLIINNLDKELGKLRISQDLKYISSKLTLPKILVIHVLKFLFSF